MKSPPPPLTLAPDNIPRDVIPALEALLEDAKKGTLIGFAITAIYTRPMRRVIAKAVGEAERSLIFTVGTLMVLVGRLLVRILKTEAK